MDYYECYDCHIALYPEERRRFNHLVKDEHVSIDNAYDIIEKERKAKYDRRTAELHQ